MVPRVAGLELNMSQRLVDTVSLSGPQWAIVIGLPFLAPAVVGIDKMVPACGRGAAEARSR